MSEIDALDHSIQALQQLQRVAWQQLAEGKITSADSRELRRVLRKSAHDLRERLEVKSKLSGSPNKLAPQQARSRLVGRTMRHSLRAE